ncbi:Hypothetical protein A7982_02140 [Minicystis rosea]|nr:Hypothetical protein A7982_02140 [Minicystis rosea]
MPPDGAISTVLAHGPTFPPESKAGASRGPTPHTHRAHGA